MTITSIAIIALGKCGQTLFASIHGAGQPVRFTLGLALHSDTIHGFAEPYYLRIVGDYSVAHARFAGD